MTALTLAFTFPDPSKDFWVSSFEMETKFLGVVAPNEAGVTGARRIGRVCEPDGHKKRVFE